jgi:hypothetical protein
VSSEARALARLLTADPVGPEHHGLALVVEVLAEEVEFGATRIGIDAMRACL